MKEYIERAAVCKACKASGSVCTGRDCEIPYVAAADVVEVKHGKWVVYGGGVFCSNCGTALKKGKIEPIGFHFCPNCGARMDKEDEHEAD